MVKHLLTLLVFVALVVSAQGQTWQAVQYANGTSPLARHENGFVEVNGKFYLIGGRGIKNVNIFDPVTRIWTAGAAPPIELHHFQAVVYQNRIYAICALTGLYPAETPVDRIYIYDPALNTWSQGATIPVARRRGSSGLVLFNNKFYIMSGIQVGHQSGWVPWTDEYDPVTGVWTILPDAPQARDHFHAGLINGKVYCAGGRRTAQPNFAANTIANVDVFDIATRTWSTPTQIPTPRGAPAVAVVNNELVVGGGEVDYSNNALTTVQSYNPVNNTWTTRPDLNVGRHATQFIYYSGTLYIVAGSTTQGGNGENNTMASAPYGSPPSQTLTNVIRINAGGTAQNFSGDAWVADQYFTGGTVYSSNNAIANTTQDPIYQTERFGNFSYAIPVGQAGTYAVDLHFAEIFFGAIGQRTFNINIENGQFVRNNFDIIQAAGANNSAYVLRADNLNITDGTINITFTTVVNTAKVSGIAVGRYSSPPANTPPVVLQAPAAQSVPNTQATVVLNLANIFNDNGGVNNLVFTVPNNTNTALISNTQISGTQLTFTLSGTTGTGTITLRATDASNAFVETTFQLTVTPPANTPPVVIQAPAAQSVPNTQATVVLQLAQIFNDNGGVNNLVFTVPNNTNAALISNTQISGTQLTFTLSGTTGMGTITLRATDASNAFVETTFQLTVTPSGPLQLTNIIRINSFGPWQNYAGELWVGDQYATGGTGVMQGDDITNTTKDEIYYSQRVGNISYAIPVPGPGSYAVDLHFAETFWNAPGQRLFNINVENGQFVRNNFDLFQAAGGKNLAYVLRADNLNITDGVANITLTAVVDAATISGVAVGRYEVTPTNTPPVIIKPAEDKYLISADGSFIVQMTEVFADDGGIGNLTYSVTGNTNPGLISNTQISGTQMTFTLSGLGGDGDITIRATDGSNAFVQDVFHLGATQGTNQPIAGIVRINAGGPAQNFNGENWEADQYFSGGSVYSTTSPINNTTRDQIYQTERFGNFSYAIPVPHAGIYGVDLHFAEIYFSAAGSRIFNINIENGQYVRSNLDLIQTIGAINTATVMRVENLNVTDGTLNITFTTVKDNAKISGIEVLEFENPNPNTPPVVVQAPAPQSVPGNQGPILLQLGQIFGDDGGVNSLQFALTNNTNPAVLSNIAFGAQNVTFTLSGTTGTTTITLRATDSNGLFVETPFQLTVTPPVPTGPVVIQAPAAQSVPNTQPTVVLNLAQIFNDDGGVNNLTFAVTNNTNAALLSNTQITGTQITFTLSGTTGSGTITLRATDATTAFVQTNFQLTVTSGVQTLTNVIRINAGGPAQNFSGQAWVADQYFTGGTVYNTTTPIANTTQDPIYQSERFGTFSYAIPVGQAGTYAVDLHFAEIFFGQAGQRVFNINVENGQFVRNNFDIMQTYGATNAAFVLRADNLNITDGTINITFTSVINNAKISGIAVGRYTSGSSARMATAEYDPIVVEPEEVKTHEQVVNYQVYPNPVQDDGFNVKLVVEQQERWNFTLMDFAGRQISLGAFELEQGIQDLAFDIRPYSLRSGIYYLTIQHGQTTKNIKLAIK